MMILMDGVIENINFLKMRKIKVLFYINIVSYLNIVTYLLYLIFFYHAF